MLGKIKHLIFPVVSIISIAIISLSCLYWEEKNRYKPQKNITYNVVSKDKKTGLSICSCGKNNFKLLKIPEDITNEMSFIKDFFGYKIVDRNNN